MKTYYIKKTEVTNVAVESREWEKANVAEINVVSPDSESAPTATARLLYSEDGITVKLETDEKPLLGREERRNGDIYLDSCLEFFVKPFGEEKYLNFEVNPLGTLHLGFGEGRHNRTFPEIADEVFDIKCGFENDKWQLKIYIPFAVFDELYGKHTDIFEGNLYNCGEETEKVHFLMWNKVESEKADFHRPEFFGQFILEK
ncbi:MAG: hypothetical protein E7407_01955 [Ruminococcaceae bacterium]|nr:hypothetical protein [Oscillospiraceae bacterium]